MPPQDNHRMMHTEPARMMQQDSTRLLGEPTHILPDNGLLNDNRLIANDATRLLVNVSEPPRLLDNRLLTNDTRLLQNVNDGNRLINADNSRVVINDRPHLAVVEGNRLLTDKYLAGYDPYHRGHL